MFKIFYLVFSLFFLNSCTFYSFQYNGVFKKPYNNYKQYKNDTMLVEIQMQDGSYINFSYLSGSCSASLYLIGLMMIPIIPIYYKNNCENDGFFVRGIVDKSVSMTLKYNNKTYDSISKTAEIFPISNFKEFKKAKDKTLIIHKKTKNGDIITKEIPFEWKLTIRSVVVP